MSVVLTFDRHPATIVRPESAPQLLTTPEQRLELLAATGLDGTVVLRFDEAQSKETPESFIERVLIDGLAVKIVVVGQDFHFGSQRDGNVRLLEDYGLAHDFVVDPVDLVARADGDRRADQQHRHPAGARRRRRRPRRPDARPAPRGARHGRRWRQARPPDRLPDGQRPCAQLGVPARRRGLRRPLRAARRRRSTRAPSTSGGGRRSTSTPTSSLLEAHLLDFEGELYGEQAEIRFEHFLRSERKFDGIDAIRTQLGHDVEHARTLLA